MNFNVKKYDWKKGNKLATYKRLRDKKRIVVLVYKVPNYKTNKKDCYFCKEWHNEFGGGSGKKYLTDKLKRLGHYSIPEEQWNDFINHYAKKE